MARVPKPKFVTVLLWIAIALSLTVITMFGFLRVVVDLPHLTAGTQPEPATFEARYVAYPWLSALHIVPGFLFLGIALFQLSAKFRQRHFTAHRRLGKVALTSGLVSGVFALAFGVPFAWGGAWEAAASVVFSVYFIAALALAYRAIRARDNITHRRWMIRAFAIGLGVASVRVWIGTLVGFGLLEEKAAFEASFWIAFSLHALAAEAYLRWRPAPDARLVRSLA